METTTQAQGYIAPILKEMMRQGLINAIPHIKIIVDMFWQQDFVRSAVLATLIHIITYELVGKVMGWARQWEIWFGVTGGRILYALFSWAIGGIIVWCTKDIPVGDLVAQWLYYKLSAV